jgi:hypothetical protein
MEGSEKRCAGTTSQFLGGSRHPAKGAQESGGPFDQIDSYLTPTGLFFIFPFQHWTATPINYGLMVRLGGRSH